MSAIDIQDVRFSFIYTESNPAILDTTAVPARPCGFVGSEKEFAAIFDTLQQSGETTLDGSDICVRMPWHRDDPTRDYFWRYYCGDITDPAQMKGRAAWRMMVPIQRSIPGRIVLPDPPANVDGVPDAARPHLWGRLDGFLYEFGVTVVATFIYRNGPSLSLEQLIALGMHLRSENLLLKIDELKGEGEVCRLDEIAKRGLKLLREDVLGAGAAAGQQSKEPFSVVTIAEGSGCDPTVAPQAKGEIHKALEALASWDPNYALTLSPTVEEQKIESKGKPIPGDLLYVAKRGRVVWFPSKFTRVGKLRRGLSCYHRNLVYLSMQVATLGEFCRGTARALAQGRQWINFSVAHKTRSLRAVDILGSIYGNSKLTYRSLSPRRQIDDNFRDEIDSVRAANGRPQLSVSHM